VDPVPTAPVAPFVAAELAPPTPVEVEADPVPALEQATKMPPRINAKEPRLFETFNPSIGRG